MNLLKRLSKLSLFFCFVLLSSCKSFTSLRKPYGETIPASIEKGDLVQIYLVDGVFVESIKVQEVWTDSLQFVGDSRAVKFDAIQSIKLRKTDPVLTGVMVLLGGALALLLIMTIAYNTSGLN